jgi:hypothetical protein
MVAAKVGHPEIVSILIKAGAHVNVRSDVSNR